MLEFFMPAASSFAADIDQLFDIIFWIVMPWFVVTEGVLFYFIFKYSAKKNPKADYITGNEKELKRYISVPHLLVILCDIVLIVGAVSVWYDVKQRLPESDYKVRIIAQQWAWTFVHPGADGVLDTPDDVAVVDELHLEVGKVYHYELESEDVMHCFSVPVFRLKQDAVPGRVITGWFEPIMEGEFDVQCAEMCGIGHGIMGARVFITDAEGRAEWLAGKTPQTTGILASSTTAPAKEQQ
jgi:cytochrome c oxidase subunit 2